MVWLSRNRKTTILNDQFVYQISTNHKEKQRLLEINSIKERAEVLMKLLQRELQFAELKNKVTTKTRTELDKQQREYFLQQQLKSAK